MGGGNLRGQHFPRGGHLSFSPVDYAYSYGHYLNFPVINLSQSGDTSENDGGPV